MVQIGAFEADPFPAAQRREPGGSIRWAVGTPDGPRSQSWSLFGSTNHDDVYLGPRCQTGAIKLSLHRSGRWRMAWTEKYASGGMVGVIVRPGPLSLGSAAKIAEIRAQMLAAVTAAGARGNTAFAWGRMADDAVLLLDPGPVEPESAGPVGIHQNGARGRLTYVRRADRAS